MAIKSPEQFYGFRMGDDRKLARWPKILEYYRHLSENSGRIKYEELGLTTEGQPFISLVISSESNIQKLDEYRALHERLSDPRGLGEDEAAKLLEKGKAVVMISSSVHASEVGGTQMGSEFVHDLLTSDDEAILQILDNVILVYVPCLNPDGLEIVAEWYESTLGTPYEGSGQPWLYNTYTGHDNNRDWFMLTQAEARLAILKVQNVWHPMIVYDQHQMWSHSFRYFLPPYIDPFDTNVDPMLAHETTVIGAEMMHEILSNGKTGITHSIIFDCFSPSRAYQHYHGGIRILSEAASCKIATPIHVAFEEQELARDGSDPKVASLRHPIPWQGGMWRLRDIIEYNKLAAMGCLKHAARYSREWVKNFYNISLRGLQIEKPYAFVIPAKQADPVTMYEMLDVLKMGLVEIHRAGAPFEAGGIAYDAGDYVVKMSQPYARYAKTLLEIQEYPDLRQYPGGPPKPPYDITAHTLGLQMGVAYDEVDEPFEAELELIENLEMPLALKAGSVAKLTEVDGFSICTVMNSTYKAINKLLADGFDVYRSMERFGEAKHPNGTFYVPNAAGLPEMLDEYAQQFGIRVSASETPAGKPFLKVTQPKAALYRSYAATADEGWTRFIFEDYGFNFENVYDDVVRAGGRALKDAYDCLIIPGQSPHEVSDGNPFGSLPPKYTGGLGEAGRKAVRDYVELGGTLVVLGPSCDWAVDSLGLRLKNVTRGIKSSEYYLPGSLMKVMLDVTHPVAYGMPSETSLLSVQTAAYEVTEGTVIGRYAPTGVLMSGWALGTKFIEDKAVITEVCLGRGRIILLSPRVQHRAQTRGAYRLLFNSVYLSTSEKTVL